MHLKLPLSGAVFVRPVAIAAVLLLISSTNYAAPRFTVKPAPSWTRLEAVDATPHSVAGASTGSSTMVLDDLQVRITPDSVEHYYHRAQRVETQAGLDDLSQLKFYFEPSYQQLTLHYIRLLRGNEVINALNPSEVKTIQEEEELDQQVYNGTLSSVVFLNDLRVGDVVDYAYTVTGDNPVFGGHFAERFQLARDRAVQKLSVSLLWSSPRALNQRSHNTELKPAVKTIGNETQYLWQINDVPPLAYEDSTPGWVQSAPVVDVSDFKEWSEVVGWALPLYKIPAVTDRKLAEKIESWKAELKTPEERTLAALRFVQDEIRYLGIELGSYSHQPTAPEKVFARRFGDCKDKAQLLATILNALGVEAAPALVSNHWGRALDERQPSPFAFNHVIVQAKLGSKTYWFDGTISFQRGGLELYYDPPYARALVIREGSRVLENIPAPARDSGSTSVTQSYTVNDSAIPVSFVVTSIFRGSSADTMRAQLASQSLQDFSSDNLNYYLRQIPSIRLLGTNEVSDDQKSNKITVNERYMIDNLWTDPKHYFYPDQILSALEKPSVAKRSTPFEIEYPNSIDQTIEIEMPGAVFDADDSDSISDSALQLSYKHSSSGKKVRLEYSLKSLTDNVPANAVGLHLQMIERMRNSLGIELARGGTGMRTTNARGENQVAAVLMIFLFAAVGVGFVVKKLRSRRSRKGSWNAPVKVRAGTTVTTAIAVSTASEITTHLQNSCCDCGNNLYREETPPVRERFTYDGYSLTGVRLKCAACTRSTDFYFRHQPEAVQPAG